MREIAVLLSAAAVLVAALGVVPVAAASKRVKGDGSNGTADENGNDVGGGGGHKAVVANDYDGRRFAARYTAAEEPATTATKAPKQSSKLHNAKLLNRLGMKRVRTSGDDGGNPGNNGAGGAVGNHHRKRLAGQSRSKYGADGGKGGSDSQMFIVKLPPHAHYYGDSSAAASAHQKTAYQHVPAPYKSLNNVPVGFVSNGKPAKVYHWNLPVIKHAMQQGGDRYRSGGGGAANDVAQLHQFQFGDFDAPSSSGSKVVPRRTLYYKPRAGGKPVKKSFVNNGKPNGFYVVSPGGKNAAAVPQYHKIVKAYYGGGDD